LPGLNLPAHVAIIRIHVAQERRDSDELPRHLAITLSDLSLLETGVALLDQVMNKDGDPLYRNSATDPHRLRYVRLLEFTVVISDETPHATESSLSLRARDVMLIDKPPSVPLLLQGCTPSQS
jgi:hypothetical protein